MQDFLNNANTELYFIYGLIAIILVLIVIIVVIDRIDSKKKKRYLSDTLPIKPVKEDYESLINEEIEIIDMDSTKKVPITKKEKEEAKEIEPVKTKEVPLDKIDIAPEEKVQPKEEVKQEIVPETVKSEDIKTPSNQEVYVEKDNDMEKTQAQLRVEEITKALEDAMVDEKIEQDKYSQFEEQQQKDAIISYEELKKSYDELYEKNEKNQYLEDDKIPININELYELSETEQAPVVEEIKEEPTLIKEEVNIPIPQPVMIDDFIKEEKTIPEEKTFKSSPYISPVYGIQKPDDEFIETLDAEIEQVNDFLNNLKELRENLK